jgi:hypothetical protein
MAEKYNNDTLWKWEYQPFEEKSPVVFGQNRGKKLTINLLPFIIDLGDGQELETN